MKCESRKVSETIMLPKVVEKQDGVIITLDNKEAQKLKRLLGRIATCDCEAEYSVLISSLYFSMDKLSIDDRDLRDLKVLRLEYQASKHTYG